MADWPRPQLSAGATHATAATASGQLPVTLTAAASANTKSSTWAEVIAATEHPASVVMVRIGGEGLTLHRNWLVDIAIGAAGAEVALISNLWLSQGGTPDQYRHFFLPQPVPKGARLSARTQCSTASDATLKVGINLFSSAWRGSPPTGPVEAMGVNLATSGGVVIPQPSANSESTWQEVIAATAFPHAGLIATFGKDPAWTNITRTLNAMDIGIGAAGVELPLLVDIPIAMNTASDTLDPWMTPTFPCAVPKGSRLSIRTRTAIAQANLQTVLYGV
jgi:hypothetical protein